MTEKIITNETVRGLWKSWTETPKDGGWCYVVTLVSCRDCQTELYFRFGHYLGGEWIGEDGKSLEEGRLQVYKWMNIELFYHSGLNYDLTE